MAVSMHLQHCVGSQASRRARVACGRSVMVPLARRPLAVAPSASGARPQQTAVLRGENEGRPRVLELIANLAEHNAVVQRFETFAGRGAMVGLVVAATFELLLPLAAPDAPTAGLFGGWDRTSEFVGLTALLCSLAAVLAVVRTQRWQASRKLLEPVITSLTSKQRSVGSVSKLVNVDKAVDFILDSLPISLFLLDD